MLAVLEPVVGPQRAQKRLLEGVVGALAPELAAQQREHLAGVLGVERLERWNRRWSRAPIIPVKPPRDADL